MFDVFAVPYELRVVQAGDPVKIAGGLTEAEAAEVREGLMEKSRALAALVGTFEAGQFIEPSVVPGGDS